MELITFINDTEAEIEEIQQRFFKEWNKRIKAHFFLPDDFTIESFVDIYGGYTLTPVQFQALNSELRAFYDQRIVKKNGIYHLRGYDYYHVDPLVHLQHNRKTPEQFWRILQKKWKHYKSNYTFVFLKSRTVSFENWIGTLGFLEYLLADIASMSWFIFRNRSRLAFVSDGSERMLPAVLNESAQFIGDCIAALLVFDFQTAYQLLDSRINQIVDIDLAAYLDLSGCTVEDWTVVRGIREGDSLVLIYAAYLMKLSPHIREYDFKRVALVSNSFGAMYIGHIMKSLLCYEFGAECCAYNVLFSQNRSAEDSIYDGDCSEFCSIIDYMDISLDGVQAIFVIDDSIFTGNSYIAIKDFLQTKIEDDSCPIRLLPLTVNCDCIKLCRRGIRPEDDLNEIALRVMDWSRQVGNMLPAFLSFWDFARVAPENQIHTVYDEVREVLQGDDRLMKHLWARFEMEIVSE